MLQQEMQAVLRSEALPEQWQGEADQKLGFVTTCLGREEQLKVTLPLNLLHLWRFRGRAVIFVLTLGDDQEIHEWIRGNLALALQSGLLVVGSGGRVGQALCPEAFEGAGKALPPVQEFWHAPWCKNTAHELARQTASNLLTFEEYQRLTLCNLDADNILTASFAGKVTRVFRKALPLTLLTSRVSSAPGVTGRLAYLAADFCGVRGYDCGLNPSGFQDEDLKIRIKNAQRDPEAQRLMLDAAPDRLAWLQRETGKALPPVGETEVANGAVLVGGALCNAPTSWKDDRGPAKVRNIDPRILQGRRWGQLDAQNRAAKLAALADGEVFANMDLESPFGAYVVVLPERVAARPDWVPPPEDPEAAAARWPAAFEALHAPFAPPLPPVPEHAAARPEGPPPKRQAAPAPAAAAAVGKALPPTAAGKALPPTQAIVPRPAPPVTVGRQWPFSLYWITCGLNTLASGDQPRGTAHRPWSTRPNMPTHHIHVYKSLHTQRGVHMRMRYKYTHNT